ncbi:MAG: hypothetical protein MUF54_07970 [Polyangiaceae bacterium]|jgi:serine/threonine-protein kinase|nr:hypothetical protein [Polyangiaceae bacterium]
MAKRSRWARWVACWSLAGVAVSTPARGQTAASEALAETLFQDGRELMQDGQFAQACPKLAESHSIDPAGGTVLLLALCYEQVGKTASAWLKFHDALAAARRDGRKDREDRARQHLQKLEPLLSRVTLSVSEQAAQHDRLALFLDGAQVPRSAWSRPLPVDPGDHLVEAKAPQRRGWSASLVVGTSAASQEVLVPALEFEPDQPPAPARPSAAAPRPAAPLSRRYAATVSTPAAPPALVILVGGLGVAALGVGGYFGVRALDRSADARDRCPATACTDPVGVRLNQDARADATRSSALVGGGLALVAASAYLWLSAPSPTEAGSALAVRPQVGGAAASLVTVW